VAMTAYMVRSFRPLRRGYERAGILLALPVRVKRHNP
jgi:hypothetical protein